MADSTFQISSSPKLYVSYPLYQYANNALDETYAYSVTGLNEEDMIRLIQIDPSQQTHIATGSESNYSALIYKIVPSYDDETPVVTSGLWNFDFCMFLGHNFNSKQVYVKINNGEIDLSNIVNFPPNEIPEYDGWSLCSLDSVPDDGDRNFIITVVSEQFGFDFNLGSVLWGKSYEFPQNTTLSTSTTFEYGIKQKTSITGKTISSANWTKPNNWITEPFGLGDEIGDNFQRRSGRRVWKMSFDYLAPDKIMNQNMMMNDIGYYTQDNHADAATMPENTSLYNINNGNDFFSSVVHKSMNHLPMVLQIDKNDNSPSNFAIVKMNKDYTIQMRSPNLYSISVTLTEQI